MLSSVARSCLFFVLSCCSMSELPDGGRPDVVQLDVGIGDVSMDDASMDDASRDASVDDASMDASVDDAGMDARMDGEECSRPIECASRECNSAGRCGIEVDACLITNSECTLFPPRGGECCEGRCVRNESGSFCQAS